jgi:hypothetical protein
MKDKAAVNKATLREYCEKQAQVIEQSSKISEGGCYFIGMLGIILTGLIYAKSNLYWLFALVLGLVLSWIVTCLFLLIARSLITIIVAIIDKQG